jgi:sulfur carrier protein ThiS
VSASIELHAYMGLADLFRQRGWTNPYPFAISHQMSGAELVKALDIAPERVEVLFVNRKAYAAATAQVQPGDRVALVPPGVPGPHRFLLGFKNR